jgi:S-adenosylmethionine hydrolase
VPGASRRACLSLLTDYGASSEYVGVCHGVALAIAPDVPVVDISHAVPARDVRAGALMLEHTIPYVPAGVHVAVVDPGVGGPRRPLAVEAGGRLFVGPDNGLLCWAADACGGAEEVVVLDRQSFWILPRSRTFDGRDLFVPVAAYLANGVSLAEVGTPTDPLRLERIERPYEQRLPGGAVELEVLGVDGFGNVQLSGTRESVDALGVGEGEGVEIASGAVERLEAVFCGTFGDVASGEPLVLVDSWGRPAVAVNGGSAELMLAVAPGERVVLRRRSSAG